MKIKIQTYNWLDDAVVAVLLSRCALDRIGVLELLEWALECTTKKIHKNKKSKNKKEK
jgi:hypothetical protein